MTIQIATSSFIIDYSNAPLAATKEAAQELLTKFTADLEADKFNQDDSSFDGYEGYLRLVIKSSGVNPPFPAYPKYKD